MPSTTNSLESYHGHLNKYTPRKNNFFSSICRIASNLNRHNKNYLKRIKHNYNKTIHDTKNDMEKTNVGMMLREQIFYKTNKNYCECSSNKLVSAQLGINIPCKHQLALIDPPEIPALPEINILLNDQWKDLIVKYNPKNEKQTNNESHSDKNDIINTIKYYSKYKGEEIDKFVDSKYTKEFQNDSEFILNKPACYLNLIDAGINYGIALKNIKREDKGKKAKKAKRAKKTKK